MINFRSIIEFAYQLLSGSGKTLGAEDRRVLERIETRKPTSRDIKTVEAQSSGFWDVLADRVAAIGGSWGFIISFLAILIAWMVINTEVLGDWNAAFDPYQYIFLNLILSMIAALQAPVIMMSQNRQAERDRFAAQHDYEVNFRSELEIMALHEKWDAARLSELETKLERQSQLLNLIARKLDVHKNS